MSDPTQVDKLARNIRFYLGRYFDARNDTSSQIVDCASRDLVELRDEFKKKKSSCAYEYRYVLAGTACDPANSFGYATSGPCVLVKLNRIYGWSPQPYDQMTPADVAALPFNTTKYNVSTSVLEKNIVVICEGEYGADRDALASANITYYSVNSRQLNVFSLGLMPVYYYPYLNQPQYKSPVVFVKFKQLPRFLKINIACRAYARNIDSDDRAHMRGMTRFQMYVTK